MNIDEVLMELDALPGGEDTAKTGEFLEDKIRLAHEEGDAASELTLLNEMIGYCRYTGNYERAYSCSQEAAKLCSLKGLNGTLPHATTLLNAATAKRAGGRLEDSLADYMEAESIYDKLLDKGDRLYAALYNNMSLLYQEMGDNEASADCLKKALIIICAYDDAVTEQAITRTNLAQAYIRLGRLDEAADELGIADKIFRDAGGNDFHYPGCLNAMAMLARLKKDYTTAVSYYREALKLLKESVGEDNPSYLSVNAALDEVNDIILRTDEEVGSFADTPGSFVRATGEGAEDKSGAGMSDTSRSMAGREPDGGEEDKSGAGTIDTSRSRDGKGPDGGAEDKSENGTAEKKKTAIKGLELSRRFYEEYGKAMIHDNFPEYEDRITVGLVGRGSECYGFDDELSHDHDHGPDFCIWVDDDVYDEAGTAIQEAYDALPLEYMGFERSRIIPPDGKRTGVLRTKEFYSRILNITEECLTGYVDGTDGDGIFAIVREEDLSQCTNGSIFARGTGDFLRIRDKLSYYPDNIWRRRIAEELHYSAQMGQYNYIRMLKRGEKVASEIALAGYMEHTMKLVYLINRRYAPYYKWLHRGMAGLEKAAVIMDIFNAVYDMPKGDERIRMTTEIVAAIIIEELEKIGMAGNVPKGETYLDVYSRLMDTP
ncbi:MAG: DUF4037 domain-containing protein [Lachnospiraceae bacterium]|nr:DUF4037 domain-containing protein [Lachnospiraceae bacterium]